MKAKKDEAKKISWAHQSALKQAKSDAVTVTSKRKLEDTTQTQIPAFFEATARILVAAPVVVPTLGTSLVVAPTPLVSPAVTPTRLIHGGDIPQIVQTRTCAPPASLPWTEKYRPASVVRVIGNSKAKETVRQWFTARQWQQPLLIAGPTGIGKTSLAHAACRDNQFMVQECNALPGDLLGMVQELLHRKGSEQVAVVLDEVHTYTSHERNELTKLFKKPLAHPVILVCDELDKSMESLKAVCKVVRMYRQVAAVGDMSLLTTMILKAESKGLYPTQLNLIHVAACGDLRRCTIMLELACKTRRCKGMEEQRADLFVDSIFDATTSLLHNKPRALTFDDGLVVFKQHNLMKWMVHENYADACDFDTAVSMATYMSEVDTLDAHPSHHLHDDADTLTRAAVGATLPPPRFGPLPRVTFPSALGALSRRKSFQATLHQTRLSWQDWRLLASNFSWMCAATTVGTKALSQLVKTHSLTCDDAV